MNTGALLYSLDLAGVAASAMSGALAAGRKQLDLFGAVVIAGATAIGGGTIRDLLLGRTPVFWTKDSAYLWVVIATTAFTVVYTRFRRPPEQGLLIADALGLAFFTILGTRIAESAGVAELTAVLMGACTGAAGGVLRDVLCNEVPIVLQSGRLYATTALLGASAYVALEKLAVPQSVAAVVGVATVAALRFAAIRYAITLPVYRIPGDPSPQEGGSGI